MLSLPLPPVALALAHLLVFAVGAHVLQRHPPEARAARLLAVAAIGLYAVLGFLAAEPPWPFEDFRRAYLPAGAAVLAGPGSLAAELGRGTDGFVNLPVVAWLFAPFALVPQKAAILGFSVLGVAAALLAWRLLALELDLHGRAAWLLLFLFAASGPLHNSVREGNTSHFVLALLAGVLLALVRRREGTAGVLLGLAVLVKPPLGLVGLYFLLRGRWRVCAGAAVTGATAAAASLALFGWSLHVDWYRLCIAPFGAGPVAAFNAQSLPALAARLERGAAGLHDWAPSMLSPPTTLLGQVLVVLLLAATAIVMLRGRAEMPPVRGAPGRAAGIQPPGLELALVVSAVCLVSPLSWSHYYAWMLLPAAWLLARARRSPTRGHPALSAGDWAALALVCLPVLDLLDGAAAFSAFHARVTSSALLAGGCLLWWQLLRRHPGHRRLRVPLPQPQAQPHELG